jgi:hypothetical protein
MKYLAFFTAMLLTMACASLAGEGRRPVEGPLPPPDTEIGRAAGGGRAYYCGDLGFVDLGAAVDGPAYYFRRRDGVIVGHCGGFRRPDADHSPQRECPPAGWTCRQPPPNLGGGGR